jgi:Na+/H+ antiporter NhaA
VVKDVAMALFFGLIGKEIVEATIPGGVLHPWRRAALPFAASAGLTVVPVALVFATAAVGPGPTLSAIKMGALVSVAGIVVALGTAVALGTGRVAHRAQ